ncbi:MAG: acyltransferase [Candidatus Gastranaerophilales bacterium]|nr:acyltransferase [Candidatus Gastranaerophilales bacterium]
MALNNKILLHKQNGKIQEVPFISGLTIQFKGTNSTVEIYEPYCFKKRFIFNRSKIKINGDNNHIVIGPTKERINSLKVINMKNNNKLFIGENFFQTGEFIIDYTNLSNMKVSIGDNCMFGQNISFMLGDWHKILNKDTKECLNKSHRGITIGNKVWIARNVTVLKDVTIPDNTIVGYGSLVTKSFSENNTILAGIPAKTVKKNISWSK